MTQDTSVGSLSLPEGEVTDWVMLEIDADLSVLH
ncbi:hypothetical protein PS847_02014 [Pseudomonas fluorescens]|uniref:Uncharacterized protein n=1 Tax=Pseudomonas fluorescens TaxID=294 RepID=A0A5E7J972_PSEFL|nr:hypothetical protein PS847_02014 [Pseudomonas fluorescens]